MSADILGHVVTAASAAAIAIPAFVLARSVVRALFPSEVIIKDRNGRIVKSVTKESLAQERPGELARLHERIVRQQRNATTAP